ncbi:PDDEXK nuclease domain-containing protein [Clostridium sp. MT-14]|mgnify:CR=1 FL=1|uniref:PDDEXK nuclease domain-containing protein n=1 Tax=Clostridium aromativorans TaxID=2836848 RepID=A0ABS8N8X1_9CLOT|nr:MULTISPECIES: PDDEXK nuclease domain-containing protein [Clostridium]KAA8676332.1 DUF1016 domain-containing protein [Clostridium sp. HV4-5-A1G]MCC9296248.1 PDDEXK nuclease domain-containing protein [Clostridium aromativorans]
MIEYHKDIESLLENLKDDVISSKNSSLMTINKNMFMLYWKIGNLILMRQNEDCEDEFISTAAQYFRTQFPNNLGFSEKNLKNMLNFAVEYESQNLVQNIASKISWSCSVVLIDKIRYADKRMEYMNEVIKKGWTMERLVKEIDLHCGMAGNDEEDTHEEKKQDGEEQFFENKDIITSKVDNFSQNDDNDKKESINDSPFIKDIISSEEMDQTSKNEVKDYSLILRDEYLIDFMGYLNEGKREYFQEQFIKCTIEFFLGLNSGFALIGSRYHVEFSGGDYYIDLLFYNLKLKCYIAVELKIGKFRPEYMGILTFHLSILDESVKGKDDSSSIGIIICKDDEKLIVQYAFKDMEKPEDAEYRLNEDIPPQLQGMLPTVEEIGCEIRERLKFV